MSESMILIVALLAGIVLGGIFYGGLWWTVCRSVSSKKRGFWLAGSFLLRACIAVGGFYFVAQGGWRTLLACLIGFLLGRICVMRFTSAPLNRMRQGIGS